MENITDKLHWRYATKKFNPDKKVSKEDLNILLETIRLSASSFGIQPYRIAVIENQEKKKELQPKAWGQQQIVDATYLLVFCARKDVVDEDLESMVQHTADARSMNRSDMDGFKDFLTNNIIKSKTKEDRKNWSAQQAYLALGFLLSAAAELEIDVCPMEGFSAEEIDSALSLSEKGLYSVALATIGYRAENDEAQHNAKARRPKEELFFEVK